MFETISAPDAPAKFRSAAAVPLAAFLIAQGYYTVYPLFARVPAALFWLIALIVSAGATGGVIGIIRVLRRHHHELDARAFAWLIAAIATTLACAWLAISLTLPWLL